MRKTKKERILYAEDNPSVRRMLSLILRKQGYDVLEAEDGRKALDIYGKEHKNISLILCDLQMPRLTGTEFARINAEKYNLPFVVCTAINDSQLALRLLSFGVHDYVVKPIEKEMLLEVVKNALLRRKLLGDGRGLGGLSGNIGEVTIASTLEDMRSLRAWAENKVRDVLEDQEFNRFIVRLEEFFLNAFEHGSLGINEEQKNSLLTSGEYYETVLALEKKCAKKITVSASTLPNEITFHIKDEGDGFDYKKYLKMDGDELMSRISLLNGRGINLAKSYFDIISYSNGGREVTVVKRL